MRLYLQLGSKRASRTVRGVEVLAWKLKIDSVRIVMEREAPSSPSGRQVSAFFAIYMIETHWIYFQISAVEDVINAPEANRGITHHPNKRRGGLGY